MTFQSVEIQIQCMRFTSPVRHILSIMPMIAQRLVIPNSISLQSEPMRMVLSLPRTRYSYQSPESMTLDDMNLAKTLIPLVPPSTACATNCTTLRSPCASTLPLIRTIPERAQQIFRRTGDIGRSTHNARSVTLFIIQISIPRAEVCLRLDWRFISIGGAAGLRLC